ncbi:Dynamin-like protein ARC5 [Camellia lanceoleosa]|uniref:Dynamin-like protein ARC5 n=1 Tax=Camellia lanceoleosa TaxID=1840588 RepID=A0ACC0HA09_9ERIC|nr:Dynamin-like protein ARC5 [Camellia lanceoleosa]
MLREALQDERINGEAFIGTDGLQFSHKLIPSKTEEKTVDVHRQLGFATVGVTRWSRRLPELKRKGNSEWEDMRGKLYFAVLTEMKFKFFLFVF